MFWLCPNDVFFHNLRTKKLILIYGFERFSEWFGSSLIASFIFFFSSLIFVSAHAKEQKLPNESGISLPQFEHFLAVNLYTQLS